ncbi:MAG: LPS export ABC transporter periplasmic protein LptC [Deltaproteobacteria bacterium]|nr:LPS export ABC transporter periplasmic protein LptC [Deltaproteobacteria bacterium]
MVSPVFIRPALVILVTSAIICILIAISRNGNNYSAPVQSAFQQLPQNIDIALKQARFSEMKDGSVVWELVAEKVEYDKSGEIAYLGGGIQMDFARTERRGAIKLTADRGEYLANSKNIKLRGKVHVVTGDGASFDTNSIDYRAAESQFKTAEMVTFRQDRLTLNATGMEMDAREQQARFFSQVDAVVAGVSVNGAAAGANANQAAAPAKKQVSKKIKKRSKKKVVRKKR